MEMQFADYTYHTQKEIFDQPLIWKRVYESLKMEEGKIKDFLNPILEQKNLRIILTGAGSSAFIGESVRGIIQESTQLCTEAKATTDLITHPQNHFLRDIPTLLVSFARSGNSPESVETVNLAEKYCDTVFYLNITCNKDGELANFANDNPEKSYNIILPEETHDKSLAMTSSFTSMLLTSILLLNSNPLESWKPKLENLCNHTQELLKQSGKLEEIIAKDFKRVVFLGSGPMLGIARECHLKLQELTDGQLICKHDSFLGFRHGPKAVADENTLIVYLLSNSNHVLKYEKDLIVDVDKDPRKIRAICYGNGEETISDNLALHISSDQLSANPLYFVSAAIIGQLMGFFAALKYNLNPDNPSRTGAISRVVQGVNIYRES